VIETVDDYIAAQPESAHATLSLIRDTIRKAVPKAEESISYNIAAYKLGGVPVLYFAGWKKHYSLYPATAGVIAALKGELAPYKVVKSTLQFPLSAPVPVALIKKIAKIRAREAAAT
jgi:uncharacterized protein YdhG (YjbR/CyaY superfamily)